MKGINKIASSYETCGPEIGSEITRLRVVNILKSNITKFNQVDDDLLEQVREAFSIMDIMSEDSWVDSKIEIMKVIDKIEVSVGKCIITLQGFDLLRQILEHRYNEGIIVMEQLEPDGNCYA